MKKSILLTAFALACVTASAGNRHHQDGFGFSMAGKDHTILRPESVKMPEGYKPRSQRINSFGSTPDAQMQASMWSILENEDGSYWFYTQTFELVNDWYYKSSNFTVYNDQFQQQATIHFDAPEGETCNSIQPFGMVTKKFFDINESTWEVLVYVHCITPDYKGKNYIYVVNNKSEVVECFDGYSAQFLESGSGFTSKRNLIIGRDEDKADGSQEFIVDVYKKAGWSTGPTVEHTFTVNSELINYSDGPAFNCFCIDDKPYFTTSYYEKPYVSGYNAVTWDPVVTTDNNYIVNIYDSNYKLVKTIKDPIPVIDHCYSMRTFGYFGYEDLNRRYNDDGTDKLDVIITAENYYTNSAEDTYLFGWNVYNEDNVLLKEFCGRAIDWWELNPIKGQPDQVACYTMDEDGNGHIEVYDLPSCELAVGFDDTVDGMPISTAFDRAPTATGYDYVTAINQGYPGANNSVIGVIAWFTPEGKLDKRVNFDLGPDAQYFTAAISPVTLDPYVFDTDDEVEYLYRVKASRKGTEALDDIIVIADGDGSTIRKFSSDAIYDQLSGSDILYNAEGKPFFFISYYASAYDDHYGETDMQIYSLPFSKWQGGGNGTEANPYKITSVGDLMHIDEDPDAYYVVEKDLDFIAVSEGWHPVPVFSGHFDGQGHVFRNFYMTDGGGAFYTGLFGQADGAVIENITFESPELVPPASSNYVGIVAGAATNGTIFNNIKILDPNVSSTRYASYFGCIAAHASNQIQATLCDIEGANINLPSASGVGGIYGFSTTGSAAKACLVEGDFTAHDCLGGMIGTTYLDSYATNCHAMVHLTADHYVGGIIGDSDKRGTVSCNVAQGSVLATGSDRSGKLGAGGIIGYLEPKWTGDDNAIACRGNLSGVVVEDAGVKTSAHRIAGFTVNDYDWTPEDIRMGKTFTEGGLIDNYTYAPYVSGMKVGASSDEGATISLSDVTRSLLEQTMLFTFGSSVDSPWVLKGNNVTLFFESPLTAIGSVESAEEAVMPSGLSGTFDLQGRRHAQPATPGFYLINGKKTIIK